MHDFAFYIMMIYFYQTGLIYNITVVVWSERVDPGSVTDLEIRKLNINTFYPRNEVRGNKE